jgi:mRNA interferase HigB
MSMHSLPSGYPNWHVLPDWPIIIRKRLIEFTAKHPKARKPLLAWFAVMKGVRFANHNEMKQTFGSADVIEGNRVVFNVGGNNYRIVADMLYKMGRVFVRKVMTHAEYDRTDVTQL